MSAVFSEWDTTAAVATGTGTEAPVAVVPPPLVPAVLAGPLPPLGELPPPASGAGGGGVLFSGGGPITVTSCETRAVFPPTSVTVRVTV